MKTQSIHIQDAAKLTGYDVLIGTNILHAIEKICLLSQYSQVFILTDEHTVELLNKVSANLSQKPIVITMQSGDAYKNIDTVQIIWQQLLQNGCDRKSVLLNLGGGVIGDMGGFAASTFMRGIDFIQIPTTLLAQVDASVGGKVGINFHGVKNSIGSITQPKAVIIDTQTLKTLPDRPFISGFGEIIKHGLIANKQYFKQCTLKKPRDFSEDELEEIIIGSVLIKKNIIEKDLTEHAQRKLVNFGHTIGHAIESIAQTTKTPLMHGEAVSIGIVAEARLSQRLGLITEKELATITKVILNAGLPIQYHIPDRALLFKKMYADKKNIGGKIKWTLIQGIGKGMYDQEVPENLVYEIFAG